MNANPDYYALLGVPPQATIGEIRRAYRRLALIHHPDKNPGNEAEARILFDNVAAAYAVLSNDHQRRLYDRRMRATQSQTAPRPSRNNARIDLAYRVLDLLLIEDAAEALRQFDRLLRVTGTDAGALDLERYLDDGDARDCEFLLAEALERAGRSDEAIHLYARCLQREAREPYFRRFIDEVRDRHRTLVFRRIAEAAQTHGMTPSLREQARRALAHGWTRRSRAYHLRRLAEALEAGGHTDDARDVLGEALALFPKLPGVKRLSVRLGIAPYEPAYHDDTASQPRV